VPVKNCKHSLQGVVYVGNVPAGLHYSLPKCLSWLLDQVLHGSLCIVG